MRETPISEGGFVGAGIGAAMMGLRPVVEIMTINFILVAMDQVINHAAKIRYMFGGTVGVPMVIRAPGGAGAQLTAQHSQSLEAWFAGCPGLKVVAPASVADAYGMLKTAIRDDDPVLFCENLVMYNVTGALPDDPERPVPFGRGRRRPRGRRPDASSPTPTPCSAPCAWPTALSRDGVEAEVVDLRSLRPLDAETVAESVRKTNRALVAEEGWATYGVGAELAARIQRPLLRRPRRAGRAGRPGGGADAILQAARAGRAAAGVEDRGRRTAPARRSAGCSEETCPKNW